MRACGRAAPAPLVHISNADECWVMGCVQASRAETRALVEALHRDVAKELAAGQQRGAKALRDEVKKEGKRLEASYEAQAWPLSASCTRLLCTSVLMTGSVVSSYSGLSCLPEPAFVQYLYSIGCAVLDISPARQVVCGLASPDWMCPGSLQSSALQ